MHITAFFSGSSVTSPSITRIFGKLLTILVTSSEKRTGADNVTMLMEKICREAQKATEPEVKEASADEDEMEEEI